jgi:putative transposase
MIPDNAKISYPERKANRLDGYDYSSEGWYFITICTKDHAEWLGKVVNEKMELNRTGELINRQWLWLRKQYNYIKLDDYTIMPNHVHGMLFIKNAGKDNPNCRDNPRIVPTTIKVSPELYKRRYNLLSKAMNAFKTTSSKLIHQSGLLEFSWQRSFYDRIIRDEKEFMQIKKYIQENPLKWYYDERYNCRDNPRIVPTIVNKP